MTPAMTAVMVWACLLAAVLLGRGVRRLLPEHHLSGETKDTVKLAMGLVATMAALVLGLLVSSAKSSYDAERTQVIQMAGKVRFLDRLLALYGPDAVETRTQLHANVEDAIRRVWPEEKGLPAELAPNVQAGDAVYWAIQHLSPEDDTRRSIKAQATGLAMELGQMRSLLVAQAVASVSNTLLIVMVSWLMVIYLSFSLFAPSNATANLALVVSAIAVSGAIFLILELDQPFGGLIQISPQPMLNALNSLSK